MIELPTSAKHYKDSLILNSAYTKFSVTIIILSVLYKVYKLTMRTTVVDM